MLDQATIQRRLRAARALIGVTVDQLADRLESDGLGAKTLGNMERGGRVARPMELRAIGLALELPYEFFTLTDADLCDRIAGAEVRRLEDALAASERQRQEDLAALALELARQVGVGIETGVLPTAAESAAKET